MTVAHLCAEIDKLSDVDRMRLLNAMAFSEAKRRAASDHVRRMRFMQCGEYEGQPVAVIVLAGRGTATDGTRVAELLNLKQS